MPCDAKSTLGYVMEEFISADNTEDDNGNRIRIRDLIKNTDKHRRR